MVWNIYADNELFNYISYNVIIFFNKILNNFEGLSYNYILLFVASTIFAGLFYYIKKSDRFAKDFFTFSWNNKIIQMLLLTFIVATALKPVTAHFVSLVPTDGTTTEAMKYKVIQSSFAEGDNVFSDLEEGQIRMPLSMAIIYSIPSRFIAGIPFRNDSTDLNAEYETKKTSLMFVLNWVSGGRMGSANYFEAHEKYTDYATLYSASKKNIENLDKTLNYLYRFNNEFGYAIYQESIKESNRYMGSPLTHDTYLEQAKAEMAGTAFSNFLEYKDFSLLKTLLDWGDLKWGSSLNEVAEFSSQGYTESDLEEVYTTMFSVISRYKFLADHANIMADSEYKNALEETTDKIIEGSELQSTDKFIQETYSILNIENPVLMGYNNYFKKVFGSGSIASHNKDFSQNFFGREISRLLIQIDRDSNNIKNPKLLKTLFNTAFKNIKKVDITNDYIGNEDKISSCIGYQNTNSNEISADCNDYKVLSIDKDYIAEEKYEYGSIRELNDKPSSVDIFKEESLPRLSIPLNGYNNLKPIGILEKGNNQKIFNEMLKISYNLIGEKMANLDFLNDYYKPLTDLMFFEEYFMEKNSYAQDILFDKKDKNVNNLISINRLNSTKIRYTGTCDTKPCPTEIFDRFLPVYDSDLVYLESILDLKAANAYDFEIKKLNILSDLLSKRISTIDREILEGKNDKNRDIKYYLILKAKKTLVESYLDFFKTVKFTNETSLTISSFEGYKKLIHLLEMTNSYMKTGMTSLYKDYGISSDYTEPLKFQAGIMYQPLFVNAVFDSMHYLEFPEIPDSRETFKKVFMYFYPSDQDDFKKKFGVLAASQEEENFGEMEYYFSKSEENSSSFSSMSKEELYEQAYKNFLVNLHNGSEPDSDGFISKYFNQLNKTLNLTVSQIGSVFNFFKSFESEINKEKEKVVESATKLQDNYLAGAISFHNNPFINERSDKTANDYLELISLSNYNTKFYSSAMGSIDLDQMTAVSGIQFSDNSLFKETADTIGSLEIISTTLSNNNNQTDFELLHSGLQGDLFNKNYGVMSLYYGGAIITSIGPGMVKAIAYVPKAVNIAKSARIGKFLSNAVDKGSKVKRVTKIKTKKISRGFSKKIKKSKIGKKAGAIAGGIKAGLKYILDKLKDMIWFVGMIVMLYTIHFLITTIRILRLFIVDIVLPLAYHKLMLLFILVKILIEQVRNMLNLNDPDNPNKKYWESSIEDIKLTVFLTGLMLVFAFVLTTTLYIVFNLLMSISLGLFANADYQVFGILSLIAVHFSFYITLFVFQFIEVDNIVKSSNIYSKAKSLLGSLRR